MRLAIAAWEKGASWRDRGWAGENNRAAMGPCTHRKSREATIHLYGEGKTDVSSHEEEQRGLEFSKGRVEILAGLTPRSSKLDRTER